MGFLNYYYYWFYFYLGKKNQILNLVQFVHILFVYGVREELVLHYSPQKGNIHLCFHCKSNGSIYLGEANCDLSTYSSPAMFIFFF